jgi:hypothetical protein
VPEDRLGNLLVEDIDAGHGDPNIALAPHTVVRGLAPERPAGRHELLFELRPAHDGGTVTQSLYTSTAEIRSRLRARDQLARIDEVNSWAIDRVDPKGDKTPFYGMFKSGSTLNQYTRTQVGMHGGDDAMLSDTPDVWNPDQQQFVSTAMDMASGTEFGAAFPTSSRRSWFPLKLDPTRAYPLCSAGSGRHPFPRVSALMGPSDSRHAFGPSFGLPCFSASGSPPSVRVSQVPGSSSSYVP